MCGVGRRHSKYYNSRATLTPRQSHPKMELYGDQATVTFFTASTRQTELSSAEAWALANNLKVNPV